MYNIIHTVVSFTNMQPSNKKWERGMSLNATRPLSQDHPECFHNTISGIVYITHAASDEK